MDKGQEDRLEYLLEALKKDSIQYKDMDISTAERKDILRGLMNIRMPGPISDQVIQIQDEYLQEEAIEKGIVSLAEIPTVKEQYGSQIQYADKLALWQGDITRLKVDAIVNAANSQMLGCFIPCHRCIDNAIHSAAGLELRESCHQYMVKKRSQLPGYEEPTGSAVLTPAYNLPCNYVIHTVGPIIMRRLMEKQRKELKSCYVSCLKAAADNGLRSIAFCCISTGECHFPNDEAAKIALGTVKEFLDGNPDSLDRVVFNVFKNYDYELYQEQLSK